MKHIFLLAASLILSFPIAHAQSFTLKGFVKIPEGQSVLFGADTVSVGSKLIWYSNKGAFRAGSINYFSLSSGVQWNSENIGQYSFASGVNTIASGVNSNAMGYRTTASGLFSTASGYYTTASGPYSTAIGAHASTNGKTGSVAIGDASPLNEGFFDDFRNDADNQFIARFNNGYKLFTSTNLSVGAYLGAGQSAWSTLSDSTSKERFVPVNGTEFLHKISVIRLGSWNYKGQDYRQNRHYGPMAQDFFAAFGRDSIGIIGNEKTINQADFDGINLIAIQALIQKVEKLEAENQALQRTSRHQQDTFKLESTSLHTELDQIKEQLSHLVGESQTSKK